MSRLETRLKSARVNLYRDAPFFGHLVNHLTFVSAEKGRVDTAGVDYNGNMYYDPDFISELTDAEIEAVMAHEVLHVAMRGHERQGDRDDRLWNVAQDVIINHLLVKSGFDLPECGIIPEDGEITVAGEKFDDLDSESFETVYGALKSADDEVDEGASFDDHIVDSDDEGEGEGPTAGGEDEDENADDEDGDDGEGSDDGDDEEGDGGPGGDEEDDEGEDGDDVREEIEDANEGDDSANQDSNPGDGDDGKDWERVLKRAKAASQTASESRGTCSGDAVQTVQAEESGLVDYRRYIQQKVSSAIPSDFTYQRPNKKSRATGVYMPSIKREHESVTVAVLLDTSGSITDDLLRQFAGEIIDLINAFDAVDLVLVQHDADVLAVDRYEDPDEAELQTIEVEGRGGTDHRPPLARLEEDRDIDPDLVVGYTDAHSRFPDEPPLNATFLWVLTHDSNVQPSSLPFGAVSRLEP